MRESYARRHPGKFSTFKQKTVEKFVKEGVISKPWGKLILKDKPTKSQIAYGEKLAKTLPKGNKPRTPLRRVSAKKAKWLPLYARAKRDRLAAMIDELGCYKCEKCGRITGANREPNLEPHHTQGRINENILVFKLICPVCHRHIHDHGKEARATGWLK